MGFIISWGPWVSSSFYSDHSDNLFSIKLVGNMVKNAMRKRKKENRQFWESLTRCYSPSLCYKVSIQVQAPLFDSSDRRDVELTRQCWERRLFWSVPLGVGYLEWTLSKPSAVLFPAEDNHATAHPYRQASIPLSLQEKILWLCECIKKLEDGIFL